MAQVVAMGVPNINTTAELVQEITAASEEQAGGAGQISSAMHQLDQVTQSNAAASEQLAASAEELRSHSEVLQKVISFFSIEKIEAGREQIESREESNYQVSNGYEADPMQDETNELSDTAEFNGANEVSVPSVSEVNPRISEQQLNESDFQKF